MFDSKDIHACSKAEARRLLVGMTRERDEACIFPTVYFTMGYCSGRCLLLFMRMRSAHLEIRTRVSYWCLVIQVCGESRTQQVLLVLKKKNGGNHEFFRDNTELQFEKKNVTHCFVF